MKTLKINLKDYVETGSQFYGYKVGRDGTPVELLDWNPNHGTYVARKIGQCIYVMTGPKGKEFVARYRPQWKDWNNRGRAA